MPLETRREAILRAATGADRLGYDGFFLPETWAHDTTVLLAEATVRTTQIRLLHPRRLGAERGHDRDGSRSCCCRRSSSRGRSTLRSRPCAEARA